MFRDTLYCYLNHKSATGDILQNPILNFTYWYLNLCIKLSCLHWFLRIGYLIFRLNNALKEAGCSRVWQPWQVACWSGRHAAVSGNVSIFYFGLDESWSRSRGRGTSHCDAWRAISWFMRMPLRQLIICA